MITLEHDRLVFRFPEVHDDAVCTIEFQRTLRIPDDDRHYPLPPGLGAFPLRHLDDYEQRVPEKWLPRGGVVMPMFQSEAMWISFSGPYPFALKIATGKINAVTGESWSNHLNNDPQDYVVVPSQPWLDGYCINKGVIRQFVAAPLGLGQSAEEQLTGEAQYGGIQIVAFPLKAKYYRPAPPVVYSAMVDDGPAEISAELGLAPGGRMTQEIYEDDYGLDKWDLRHSSRCFVTIANSLVWQRLTGELPPTRPFSANDYADAGLPWFTYYGGDLKSVDGSKTLEGLKSIADFTPTESGECQGLSIGNVVRVGKARSSQVREADLS